MEVATNSIVKTLYVSDGKIRGARITNLLSGDSLDVRGYEFAVCYEKRGFPRKKSYFDSSEMTVVETYPDGVSLAISRDGTYWTAKITFVPDGTTGVIRKFTELKVSDDSVFIDYIDLDCFDASGVSFKWTVPLAKKRVYTPAYVTTMGQPYYVDSFFFGGEFPVADNRIYNNLAYSRYFIGRTFGEIAENGIYRAAPFVIGSGRQANFYAMRADFLSYIAKISAQPVKFRVQYNSWYDNMLDIDSGKIEKSFRKIAEGFRNAGFRPLDCYVVDDGWINYRVPEFWAFDRKKFPEEFEKERKLTEELGSTFGVWFGPRGGYTSETPKYAKRLASIGYPMCKQSRDICAGNPNYIRDLCAEMADFTRKFNVSYFKIDGFAVTPCKSRKHGHPEGRGDGLYFYTFLWEKWTEGFAEIRKARPDVFLNVTSYAHCSPWFLKWCDAVWLNNCADMGYVGKGNDLAQCLNYRDGKYRDFYEQRQLQFPPSNVYNHEPCYAVRNCNPPFRGDNHTPSKAHPTVTYDINEFKTYLYACMMRGTGFVELYFSPEMFDAERYAAAAEVLSWAERNFDVLKNSRFFGDAPETGGIYGYYAFSDGRGYLSVRNSSDAEKKFSFDRKKFDFDGAAYEIAPFFPTNGEPAKVSDNGVFEINLKPFEIKLFEITV